VKHLHHFKLAEDPFRNEPLLRFLFESRQQQEALLRLDRAVRQAKGLCVLTGEVGSGKTMVVRQLLDNLEEEVFEASMLVVLNGAADAAWMLTRFGRLLGIEEPPRERESLLAQIYERLAIIREDGRHAVLIIDDAQALSSPETLSEVCGLLKLEYEDRRLLTLVLAGTPGLAEALASDPVLAHRVDAKVTLEAGDPPTTAAYVAHRVRCAGGDPRVFDPGAVAALHQHGRGIPGLMNTLADNALFEAFLCGRASVSALDVDRAHRDLSWEPLEAGPALVSPPAPAAAPEATARVASPAPAAAVRQPFAASAMAQAPAAQNAPDDSFGDLDSELEAVFAATPGTSNPNPSIDPTSPEAFGSYPAETARPVPRHGPPKTEPEVDDLFVELLDD
jgi:general secretion pathway protein A